MNADELLAILKRDQDMRFELDWANNKLNLAIRNHDELAGMIEYVIDRFSSYGIGDLWTLEDSAVILDIRDQLEDME